MCVYKEITYLFKDFRWYGIGWQQTLTFSCRYFSKSIFDRIKDHHGLVKIMNFIPKLDRQKLMIVSNKVKIALRFSS